MKPNIFLDLGSLLKERRQILGYEEKEFSKKIGISEDCLNALEKNNIDFFHGQIYFKSFLKKILSELKFEEQEKLLDAGQKIWDDNQGIKPKNKKTDFSFTEKSKSFSVLAMFFLFILLGGFLTIRFTASFLSPNLVIISPQDGQTINLPFTNVVAKTESESQLTLNGRKLRIDEVGNINDKIDLSPGLNTLDFIAVNKFGRRTEKSIVVLVN